MEFLKMVTTLRDAALVLGLTALYLLLVSYASLAITVLQIRQQIGLDFDTIFELSTTYRNIEVMKRDVISLAAKAAASEDKNAAQVLANQAALRSSDMKLLEAQS